MIRDSSKETQEELRTAGPYTWHRAGLMPLLSRELSSTPLVQSPEGTGRFAAFLYQQRLQMLWLELINEQPNTSQYKDLAAHLAGYAKNWTAHELPQQRILPLLHQALADRSIPYFLAKGAHLRAVLYDKPQLRPTVDIDAFVGEADRERAIKALLAIGFEAQPLEETLSHELKLTRQHGDIDLHWDLFRPGRARPGLMDWLFEHREKFGDYWGLDATASLLVMLVHPAITKYLLSPTSMLIHQVDQAKLIQSGKVDWKELESTLNWSGTATAAWSSLYALKQLAGIEAPHEFAERIEPGRLHGWYLRQWIDRAWITKAFGRRWLVAGFFSLALQDSLGDSFRALRAKARASDSSPSHLT